MGGCVREMADPDAASVECLLLDLRRRSVVGNIECLIMVPGLGYVMTGEGSRCGESSRKLWWCSRGTRRT